MWELYAALALGWCEAWFWDWHLRGAPPVRSRLAAEGLRLILGPVALFTTIVARLMRSRRFTGVAGWLAVALWTIAWVTSAGVLFHELFTLESWFIRPGLLVTCMGVFELSPILLLGYAVATKWPDRSQDVILITRGSNGKRPGSVPHP